VREDYRNIREDYKNNMEERFPPRKPYERHDSLNNNNMPIRIQSRNSDEPRGLKLNPPRNNFESREKTVYKTNNNNKDGAVLSDWANSCDDEQMDFNQPLIFADSKFEEEKQRKEKLKREEELKRQEEFERKKTRRGINNQKKRRRRKEKKGRRRTKKARRNRKETERRRNQKKRRRGEETNRTRKNTS